MMWPVNRLMKLGMVRLPDPDDVQYNGAESKMKNAQKNPVIE